MNTAASPRHTLAITAMAYLPSLLGMMTIGVVVPFLGTLGTTLSASGAQLGLAIALFSVPTAALATVGGGLIDRYGVRRALLFALAMAAAGSALASQTHSLLSFDVTMMMCGLGFGSACVSAPCLIITGLQGSSRLRAMSFLSTYAPTGYAAGLLLAVPFIANGGWRHALQLHSALLTLCLLLLWRWLPDNRLSASEQRPAPTPWRALLEVLREPRALRLGVAVALPNALSYGTSLAAPAYLARVHGLSLATSSAAVALAKITAMIIGGLSMGYLLSRQVRVTLLFGCMVLVGATAQLLLFLPTSNMALATAALILWLFAFGGMSGGAMTLLQDVVPDPTRSGAASGLVNQFISLASFAAPSTWLALHDAGQFVGLAWGCLLLSLLCLPGRATAARNKVASDRAGSALTPPVAGRNHL